MQESRSFERCVVQVENVEDDSTPKMFHSNFGNFGVLFLCQFCKNLMKQVLKCDYCNKELDCSMQELDSIAFEEVTLNQIRWLEYVQFMSSQLPASYDLHDETFNPQDLPKFCRVVNGIENEILKQCKTISNLYFNFERNEIPSNSDTSVKMQESRIFEHCVVKVENVEDDSTSKLLIVRVLNDWNKFVLGFDCKKKALNAFIKQNITEDGFQEAIESLCDDLILTEKLLQKYVCLSTLVEIQCEAQRKLAMEFLCDQKFFEYLKKYEWQANNLENCLKCYVDSDSYSSHDVVKKLKFLNQRFSELSSNVHKIQIKAEDIPPRKNLFEVASIQDLDEALKDDVGEALRLQLHFSDEKITLDISGDEEEESSTKEEESEVENQKISNNEDDVSYEMHELNKEDESEEFSKTEENLVENQKISNKKDDVPSEMHELNKEDESEEFSKTDENLFENQKISNKKDDVPSEMHELNKEDESEEFSKTDENLFENQKISNKKDDVPCEMHEVNKEEGSEEFSETEENLVENQKISNNKDDFPSEMHELNEEEESEECSKTEENLVENQKISNNKDDVPSEMHELNKKEESDEFSKTEENLVENQKISNNKDDVPSEMHELNKKEESDEFSKTEENLVENQKISNNKDEVSAENYELYEIKDNYDCPLEIKCLSVYFEFLKTFVQAENIIIKISSDGVTFPIQLENGSPKIHCKLTPSLVTDFETDFDAQPNKLVFTVNDEFFNDLKEKGFQSDDFNDSKAKKISFAIKEWPDVLTKRLLIVFCQTDSLQDLESESIYSDSSSEVSNISSDTNQSDANEDSSDELSTDSYSSSSSEASSKVWIFPLSSQDISEEEEDDFDMPEECISKEKDFAGQIGDEIQSDRLTEDKNKHLRFEDIISNNDSDDSILEHDFFESDEEEDDFDMPEECISKLKDFAIQIADEIQSDWLTEDINMHLQFEDIISNNGSNASTLEHDLFESDDLYEQGENEMQSDLLTEDENMDLQSEDNESCNDSNASPPQHSLIEINYSQESIFNQITQPLFQHSVTDDNESRAEEKKSPDNKLELSDTQDSIFNENTQILLQNSVTDDNKNTAEEKELPANKVDLSDTEKSVSDEITQPLLQYTVTSDDENTAEEKALPAKKSEFSVTQKHGLETSHSGINSQRKGTSECYEDDSMTLFGSGDLFPGGGDCENSFQEDITSQSPKNYDIQEHSLEMSDSGTKLEEKETSKSFEDNSITVSVKEKGVKRKSEGDSDILNFNSDYSKRICVEVSSLAFDNEVEITTSDEVESSSCAKQQAKLPSPTKQQTNPLSPTKPTSPTKQQTKSPSPTKQFAKPLPPTKQSIKLPSIEQQTPPPQSKEQPYNFRSCKTSGIKNFSSPDLQDTEKSIFDEITQPLLQYTVTSDDENTAEEKALPAKKSEFSVTQKHGLETRHSGINSQRKGTSECYEDDSMTLFDPNVAENPPHILRSHKVLEKEKSAIDCMSHVPQNKKNDEDKVPEGQLYSLPQPARKENEECMSIDSSSNSGSDFVVVFESPPKKSKNTFPEKDNDATIKQSHTLRSHKTPEKETSIVESKLTIQSDKGSDLVVVFESPKKDNDTAIKQLHILRSHKTPENEKAIVESKFAIQSDKGSDLEVLYESPRKQLKTQPLKETLSKKVGKQKQSAPEKLSPSKQKVDNTKKCKVLLNSFTFKVWLDKQRSFELNNRDLASLSPTRWLRGNIIDFYLQYIIIKSNYQGKTHLFSTDFYSLLSRKKKNDEALVQSVTRSKAAAAAKPSDRHPWTKNIDIFSQDFIIIPANIENVHWILIIITFLKNVCLEELKSNDTSEKPSHILRSRTSSENEKSTSVCMSRATRSDRGNDTSKIPSHILRSRTSSENEKSTSVCMSRATRSDRGNDTSEKPSHLLRSRTSSENEKSTFVCMSQATRSDRGKRSSSETKPKAKVPKIFVYDSLKSDNKQVVSRIRNFLQEEWEFKKKGKKSFDEKVLPLGPGNSAEQLDNHSCGLYVFYFLENFFKKKMFESNEELTIDEHFRPALKRKEVLEAILKLKKTIVPV